MNIPGVRPGDRVKAVLTGAYRAGWFTVAEVLQDGRLIVETPAGPAEVISREVHGWKPA